ncbi:hypothetical protein [Nocardioides sp. zg-DK7169]|uniref:hypothetical protein n=1 Tax=Nocardioides sp. zg-DK7169 TaxID=2736600 RepID=UPI001552D767|nr:hypothetical protein [Nocardioides sp. zg-DK7169]NPC99127.1 hypothetical protein [Nocardioides sp. zg-DK7169]
MYRIEYALPNPQDPDRSLPATLGEFQTLDEARDLARWALAQYGRDVSIVEYGSLGDPKTVEVVSE